MTDGSGEWEETLARGVEDNEGHDITLQSKQMNAIHSMLRNEYNQHLI